MRAWAYADPTTGDFVYGPEPAETLYRLEGDSWNGHFFLEQGARGSFFHSTHNQALVQCPKCRRPLWGLVPLLLSGD